MNLTELVCDIIASPIAKLANISFETGVDPERLKIAKVHKVHKFIRFSLTQ